MLAQTDRCAITGAHHSLTDTPIELETAQWYLTYGHLCKEFGQNQY